MTVEVWVDGQKRKEVKIDAENLFTFDNAFVLAGDALEPGPHTVELRKSGTGPLYWNGYLTNFTLEDDIRRAGLELKVDRRYYKLTPVDKSIEVAGGRGQVVDQQVEKYDRTEIAESRQRDQRRSLGNRARRRIEKRLRVHPVRRHEGGRAASRSPCKAATTATSWRVHRTARQPCRTLRPAAGPRPAQRELPHEG